MSLGAADGGGIMGGERVLPLLRVAFGAVLVLAAAGLALTTLIWPTLNEPWFVATAYYALFALVLLYAGVRGFGVPPGAARTMLRENAAGLLVAAAVGAVVVLAVPAALRVLADEANLVGVSKHLYQHRAANFPITGKWYFENYWTLTSTVDRRPALFPFLVSLVHLVRGYRVDNAFVVNALALVALVFGAYRLAKSLGGEVFGVAASLLVGAHPNVLVAARSAGFDLLATCLLVAVAGSYLAFERERTPRRLAVVALELCLLANVRYEGVALLVVGAVLLVVTGRVRRATLAGYGWLYSILPLLLLPRFWQSIAKAGDSEQPVSASLFGWGHFVQNTGEYFGLLARPLDPASPHSPLVVALALGGLLALVIQAARALRKRAVTWSALRVALFLSALVAVETGITFAYVWGRPVHPAAVRLFVWLDVTTGFFAAWLLTLLGRWVTVPVAALGRRARGPLPIALAALLFAFALPGASEARFTNSLTLTRQAAALWRFFAGQGDRQILILSDRPGLFAIYDYGALDITTMKANRAPLFELSRHLYREIYLVQEVDLATQRPEEKFDPWPDVPTETVLEFQNTESRSVRVARVKH